MTDHGRRKALKDQVNDRARINLIIILGCSPHPILSPLTYSVSEASNLALRASPTPKAIDRAPEQRSWSTFKNKAPLEMETDIRPLYGIGKRRVWVPITVPFPPHNCPSVYVLRTKGTLKKKIESPFFIITRYGPCPPNIGASSIFQLVISTCFHFHHGVKGVAELTDPV